VSASCRGHMGKEMSPDRSGGGEEFTGSGRPKPGEPRLPGEKFTRRKGGGAAIGENGGTQKNYSEKALILNDVN